MQQENKMGVMPVNRLILSMSVPLMLSMLVQALYNVVDSVFVSRINENALTAVTLAFPLQNLMMAIAVGTGVGLNALVSKCLGAKEQAQADRAARNGLFLTLLSCLAFLIFGLFAVPAFFRLQTGDAQILDYGCQYLRIICIASFGGFGQVLFERLLQSTGKTFLTMITQGVGALINIIFDPIFIFGYFGMPAMGVAGAALATVLGQTVAMGLALWFNLRYNHELSLSMRRFRPSAQAIGHIYAVGLPSIIMLSIGTLMTLGMNSILLGFSNTAAAVFGVYFRLQSFFFMPIFGLNNGMVPIIAYNYGARRRGRITKTIKLCNLYAALVMAAGTAVFAVWPDVLLGFFDPSDAMLAIGRSALRIISASFLLAGYNIIAGSVFQALGNGLFSLLMSVVRQLVVLLPAAWLLAQTGRLDLVWWAFPISEVSDFLLATFFLRRVNRRIITPLAQPAPAAAAALEGAKP